MVDSAVIPIFISMTRHLERGREREMGEVVQRKKVVCTSINYPIINTHGSPSMRYVLLDDTALSLDCLRVCADTFE